MKNQKPEEGKREPIRPLRNQITCARQEIADLEYHLGLLDGMLKTADQAIQGVMPIGYNIVGVALGDELQHESVKVASHADEVIRLVRNAVTISRGAIGADLDPEEMDWLQNQNIMVKADFDKIHADHDRQIEEANGG